MINSNKSVTAVVVVYNGEKYLKDCLQSIVDQDYQPLEILVIDDGSTDSTPSIIKSFGRKIIYFRQDNAGIAIARNKGIELAIGEYIAFLDADDIWCPGKITAQMQIIDTYPQYAVVFGGFDRIDGSFEYKAFNDLCLQTIKPEIDEHWSGWLYPRMLLDSWVHIITAVFPKKIVSEIGGFDPDKKVGEDYDFWIRVSKKYQMAKISCTLALYRDNPGSVTTKFNPRNYGAEIVQNYIREYGVSDPHGGKVTTAQIKKRLHEQWFMHGYIARNNRKYKAAVQSFTKALRYAPFNLGIYKNILCAIFHSL